MAFEIGRICVKIAGRDAGRKCVIVDVLDGRFVLIDGQTRRRKCNILHLEPLDQVINIKKKASHDEVSSEFKALGIDLKQIKPKKAGAKPKKVRKIKVKEAVAEDKKAKAKKPKAEKKAAKEEEAGVEIKIKDALEGKE